MQEYSLTEEDLFPPFKTGDPLRQINEIHLIRMRRSIKRLEQLDKLGSQLF